MNAIRRRLALVRTGDRGFTLVETIVGTVVASLVMAAAGVMFDAALRSNQSSEARMTTINDARIAVSEMGRTLRTAVLPSQLDDAGNKDTAFLQAESMTVSFYADIDNPGNTIGPSRVSYRVDAGNQLIETLQRPLPNPVNHSFQYCDPTTSGCAVRTTVLAQNVDVTSPVFVYYDNTGAVMPYNTTCAGVPCLAGPDLANVDAVDIKVVLKPATRAPIGPTTYLLRVGLPNHDSLPKGAAP